MRWSRPASYADPVLQREHLPPIGKDYRAEGILRDGGSIWIRAVTPADCELVREHFAHLSTRSAYLRFLGARHPPAGAELERFSSPDFEDYIALAATLQERGEEHIVGFCQCFRDSDHSQRAEVAFSVLDSHQGRGIGTLLLEHMVRIARSHDISEFTADVLSDNSQMLQLFRDSGFLVKRSIEAGVFDLCFPTEDTEDHAHAAAERERIAAAESIRPLLEPKSVAIIGASADANKIGGMLLRHLVDGGFKGKIFPVNPRASEVSGRRAYPNLAAIGQPIDLAVIAVPAPAVEAAVRECADADVRGVVVISAGFAEASPEGRSAEKSLRELVRKCGMRMVGPNCMGVLNASPKVALNATFGPQLPPAGNIGMSSQSGALGLILLEQAQAMQLGLSTFVSVGNKADVSGNDLLAYWAEDPNTRVIAFYLESFGNPRKFARIAPEVARRKPIVAVKSGRSTAGARAALSHSAALANVDIAVDALFEQAGVIRTDTLGELFNVLSLLSSQPVPLGSRVGVITNAGGPGILLADACEARGLQLPTPAPATHESLRRILPPHAGFSNPIDMIASATPEQFRRTIEALAADPNVDSLIVIFTPVVPETAQPIAAAIAAAASSVGRDKPLLVVWLTSQTTPAELHRGTRGRIPAFRYPEDAAIALAASDRYGRWLRRPRGTALTLDRFARSTVRAIIDRVLLANPEGGWLSATDLASVLAAAGIKMVPTIETTAEDAANAAARLGYPVVAKAVAEGLIHKTDVGAVILGLDSADAVRVAVSTLQERLAHIHKRLDKIIVQRQADKGIEALVGLTSDPIFGPLLVCGLGGVLVELVRDVSFRLTPVSNVDADEMIAKLRSGKLLDGYRGSAPGDRAAFADVLMRVSALSEVAPELRELDLNPVVLRAPGEGAVVLDARMRIAPLPQS